MTAFIRPSLILRMDLDERLFNDECVSDNKRSYSYVAPSLVQAHKQIDGQRPENVMRFMIKLHRAYWDKSDEAAQQNHQSHPNSSRDKPAASSSSQLLFKSTRVCTARQMISLPGCVSLSNSRLSTANYLRMNCLPLAISGTEILPSHSIFTKFFI